MGVSPENKAMARHAASAFGGLPTVRTYNHDKLPLSVDILRADDRPCRGVTTYSTLRLSDHTMLNADGSEFPTRLELAGACATASEAFPNVLATAAFCIIRAKKLYAPGSVIPGCVREYFPDTTVPHLYLNAPFLWNDALKSLDCGTKRVAWLLAMPISEAEHRFLKERGDSALEDVFEREQIDIFDLDRPSAV